MLDDVYVMTDDYRVNTDLKNMYPEKSFHYLVDTEETGWWESTTFLRTFQGQNPHNEGHFHYQSTEQKKFGTYKLLQETMICAGARKFVGAYSSNVAKCVS